MSEDSVSATAAIVADKPRFVSMPPPAMSIEPRHAANIGRDHLLRLLRAPDTTCDLSVKGWEALISQARCIGVWSQIAARVRRREDETNIPQPVWRRIEATLHAEDVRATKYRWEVNRLRHSLRGGSCPLILLKGAAYLQSGAPWAEGRHFQDVDILVPHAKLAEVESALRRHGWVDKPQSDLDVSYLRQNWQEIPPLWHPERNIQVDIHYSIIPPRDRLRFDPAPLFEDIVAVDDAVYTLSPVDMFLHAASNLFRTGEFNYLLRDLYDMHSMIGAFSSAPDFWPRLTARAARLNLNRPLFYALRYLPEVFETKIPAEVAAAAECGRPNGVALKFVDYLVRRTLFPNSLDETDAGRNFALQLREYWAVPRMNVLFTGVFWLKRLPMGMQTWLGLHHDAQQQAKRDEPR